MGHLKEQADKTSTSDVSSNLTVFALIDKHYKTKKSLHSFLIFYI